MNGFIRIIVWLMVLNRGRSGWVVNILIRLWATKMALASYSRYRNGIEERIGMGMTFQQAKDRAWKCEQDHIEKLKQDMRDLVVIAKRRIEAKDGV